MEPKYEDQFAAFIDFLGFSEVSTKTDDATRLKVLELLVSLSALRGEFDVQSTVQKSGKTSQIRPAVSSFSDHIVYSFPLQPLLTELGEVGAPFFITHAFARDLATIAAAALRIGFLVRGGATIGKLYHAGGVVFGEALVEAFQLESRTSFYPRVVLSPKITSRPMWIDKQSRIAKDNDGLYHFDYFSDVLFRSSPSGLDYATQVKTWLNEIVVIISRNLTELERSGRLNELSKWAWFARQFRDGLERVNPQLLKALGVSLDVVPWSRSQDRRATNVGS